MGPVGLKCRGGGRRRRRHVRIPVGANSRCGGRPHGAAPTAEIIPGTLVRQSQAHSLNRTSSNFCKPRAQWPGGNLERHSDFTRRKYRTTYQEGVLRNGVRGKRPMDLGGTEWSRSQSDASPGAFWFLCRHGQRNSPPAGGEIPLRKAPPDTARRVVAPYGRDKISEGGEGKPPPYRSAKRRRKWRNPCRKEQKQNGHRLSVQNRLHQTVR